MKNYEINFATNTITITQKFAKEASQIGTEAFKTMMELRQLGMTIITKAPVQKKKNSNLTYAKMERYISLLEDEAFSSMPWEERSWQMSDLYGIDVSDRTLRNWASYLFRGEFLMKDKENRTVWYSEVDGSLKVQVQVKNPDEDTTYQNYLQERKERVELLRKSGMPFSKAYKETVCFLWEKYHRIYYYCYTLVSNAIHLDELIEILRAAIQDDIL